jgi:hypothetical protein
MEGEAMAQQLVVDNNPQKEGETVTEQREQRSRY